MIRKCIALLFSFALSALLIVPVSAHPGDLDDDGGHYNRATGEYHYHHGYPEHQHTNGTCPYDFDDKTGENSGTSGSSNSSKYDDLPIQIQKKEKITWDNISNFLYWLFISPFLIAPVFFWILSLIPDNPEKHSASQQPVSPKNSMSSPATHQSAPSTFHSNPRHDFPQSAVPISITFRWRNLQLAPVASALITHMAYHTDAQRLFVRMQESGIIYAYYNVPPLVYYRGQRMSVDQFFTTEISGKFPIENLGYSPIPSSVSRATPASPPEPPVPSPPEPTVPPNPSPQKNSIPLHSTDSSAISHWGYDVYSQRLFLRMRDSGIMYVYFDVPYEVAAELRHTPSVGRYYNTSIKGKYYSRNLGYKAVRDEPPRS